MARVLTLFCHVCLQVRGGYTYDLESIASSVNVNRIQNAEASVNNQFHVPYDGSKSSCM